MAEQLTIANLLSLLSLDEDNELRKNVMSLCREAEAMRRRKRYDQAVSTAEMAAGMARFDYDLLGITLLYASSIYLSSPSYDQRQRATSNCGRAIRILNLSLHNQIIALVIRAKIELAIDSTHGKRVALAYLNQATNKLEDLINEARIYNQQIRVKSYRELRHKVKLMLGETQAPLIKVDPVIVLPKQARTEKMDSVYQEATIPTRPGQSTPTPIKLPVPTKLIWPPTELPEIEFATTFGGVPMPYIEISTIPIQGRVYKVNPIVPTSSSNGLLRLLYGQQYFAYQIDNTLDQRVLVRRQSQPDQNRQFIIVNDTNLQRAWIDDVESFPPFTTIHILGAQREWKINDGTDPLSGYDLRVIGVAEAILTPIATNDNNQNEQLAA